MKTAEEFLDSQHKIIPSSEFDIRQVMIDFAKLHVKQALKEASENVSVLHKNYKGYHKIEFPYSIDDWSDLHLDKNSIINAYPLENIK